MLFQVLIAHQVGDPLVVTKSGNDLDRLECEFGSVLAHVQIQSQTTKLTLRTRTPSMPPSLWLH